MLRISLIRAQSLESQWASTNAATVEQQTYKGVTAQQWNTTSLGGNKYKITGVQSKRVLDVNAQLLTNGAAIQIWGDNGGSNQQWVINPITFSFFYVQAAQSGLMMEIPAFSTQPGTKVDQWAGDGGTNQQWSFIKL